MRGIAISLAYLFLTVVLQQVARYQFVDRLDDLNIKAEQVSVRPAPLNAILWNANVRSGSQYYLGEYSFFDTRPVSFTKFEQNADLLGEHLKADIIERLIVMSEGWYCITRQQGKLYFNDLRFGTINDDAQNPEFVFRYELIVRDNEVIVLKAESPSRAEPGKLLRRLWKRIWGN